MEAIKRGIGHLFSIIFGKVYFGETITKSKILAASLMIPGVVFVLIWWKKNIFLITLLYCIKVYGDRLVLTNGDIISGDILNISKDEVAIKTIYDKKIVVPFNLISELESQNSIILVNNSNQNITVNNLKKMDKLIYLITDDELVKIEKSKINSLSLETSSKKIKT